MSEIVFYVYDGVRYWLYKKDFICCGRGSAAGGFFLYIKLATRLV